MAIQTLTFLHALPDLSVFKFRSGKRGAFAMRLAFTVLRSGIYDLSIEHRAISPVIDPNLFTEEDAEQILYTVIQIIELYTERYPGRIIRLKGRTELQTALFRVMLRLHHDILCPLFSIDKEGGRRFFPFRRNAGDSVFLLKRRADQPRASHPTEVSVMSRSRLFGSWVHLELHHQFPQPDPAG